VAHEVVVPPPVASVYRVAHGPDPFAPRAWEHAHDDGTFGNRFDDPGGMLDPSNRRGVIPVERRFRTIYFATEAAGAFGETIARFRTSPRLWLDLKQIDDDDPLDPAMLGGEVPAAWRIQRLLGVTQLSPSLRFVDIAAPETRTWLTREFAPLLAALEVSDLDLTAVMDKRLRRLTQEIARFVFEQTDDMSGTPAFAGLRYLSRLHAGWELWAVFADRLVHDPAPLRSILPDDVGLIDACARLGLAPPQPF
jgi:hypothetical protein